MLNMAHETQRQQCKATFSFQKLCQSVLSILNPRFKQEMIAINYEIKEQKCTTTKNCFSIGELIHQLGLEDSKQDLNVQA